MIEAANRFFWSAKKDGAGAIMSRGKEAISDNVAREYPNIAELSIDHESELEPYPDMRIEILALDRLERSFGWAGSFLGDEIEPMRLTMDLASTVDLAELGSAKVITADTLVEFRYDDDDDLVPWKIHVLKVIEIFE